MLSLLIANNLNDYNRKADYATLSTPTHYFIESHSMPRSTQEFTVFTKNWANITRYGSELIDLAFDFNKLLHDKFDVVEDYKYLNMTIVRSNEHAIKRLANHRAFQDAVVFQEPISEFHKVLNGLNSLQNQYLYQVFEWSNYRNKGIKLPNEAFEGGIYPPADYPKSTHAKHVCRPDRKYECPPAYMPVLNVSFGPKYARNTQVDYALHILAETRLLTVSAGNRGPSCDRHSKINDFIRNEPHDGIIVVGATDETGRKLATYSSTGLKSEKYRRPCVVAQPGQEPGTSFAAPKVANLACLCFDAIFQLSNIECMIRSEKAAGVPLVGWGIIDKLNGSIGLPGRSELPAMPFIGVYEKEVADAFAKLHKENITLKFGIHGRPVRQLILECAETIDGYSPHEIGRGFVSQTLLLDYLAKLHLGKILRMFCSNIPMGKIPASVWNLKPFDRCELDELANIANASRPIWIYDYDEPRFVVNRMVGGELATVSESHGSRVACAGAGLI
jgi:hypothetical protein